MSNCGFGIRSNGIYSREILSVLHNKHIFRPRYLIALFVQSDKLESVLPRSLRPVKKRQLNDLLSSKLFLRELKATSHREAIHEMTVTMRRLANLDVETVEAAVWAREDAISTGIGNGVALPHARIGHLKESLVAVGISANGIDFDAPDDRLANVIFLVLTPIDDSSAQLDIASEIARMFSDHRMADAALRTKGFTDFLALIPAGIQWKPKAESRLMVL